MEVSAVHCETQLLAQAFHVLQGVYSRAQHEEHRSTGRCLLVGYFEWDVPFLHILGAQLFVHKEAVLWNYIKRVGR